MEDKIKLSIILPIYNVEKYLQRILNQLYEQIRVDVEVIMVNDGSPDNSEKICQKYVNKCNQFRFVTQENAGVSVARNHGMNVARGEYIAFIDPDDTISSTYVQDIMAALVSKQDIYVVKYQKVYPDERIEGPYNKWNPGAVDLYDLYNMCSYQLINEAWGKVYKVAFLKEHNIHFIPGMKVAEDACFSVDCFLATKSVEVVGGVHYFYWQHPTSTVHQLKTEYLRDLMYMFNRLLDFAEIVGLQNGSPFQTSDYVVTAILEFIEQGKYPCKDVCNAVAESKLVDRCAHYKIVGIRNKVRFQIFAAYAKKQYLYAKVLQLVAKTLH